MKVSEATEDHINRFNAEVFEPFASLPRNGPDYQYKFYGFRSPRKAWVIDQIADGRPYGATPLDFCHSADGLKMMLERMMLDPPKHFGLCISAHGIALTDSRKSIHNLFRGTKDEWFRRWDVDLQMQRSIAEAFAIANGWKE